MQLHHHYPEGTSFIACKAGHVVQESCKGAMKVFTLACKRVRLVHVCLGEETS
jgi:hypothetical protein